MIGKSIYHYQITGQLGSGGMGVVYEALDTKLNRTVALKFLPSESIDNPEAKKRFIHEAQAASALDHPNICTIYEIAEFEGRMYIAMACYEGESLKDRIDRGPMSGEEIVRIIGQIAEGMAKAHENGIVHRDLKPANIIITFDDTVKIVDFGLAVSTGATRLTKTGASVGTLAYMSPEQVNGEEITPRTDIWSLGVMIFEMMEGASPFMAEHQAGIVYGIAHRDPEPPALKSGGEVDEALESKLRAICSRSLIKDPADRYSCLNELLADLRTLGKSTLEMSGRTIKRPRARRKRRAFMALAAVFVVAVIWIGWTLSPGPGQKVPSIAVLPLQNISRDSGQDFFAQGITGELIVGLGRFEGMDVISRTSVMKYQGSDKTLPAIARELGVDLILEGTIQMVDNQVKVTAQLIDAARDKLLWADSYNRSSDDIMILQSEIAGVIARQVLQEISPEQEARLASSRKVDPQVYEFYLRGKQMVEEASFRQAREYFERAIALDSTFAPAYAALSGALQYMGQFGWEAPETIYPPAKEAARKAQELGSDLPEVHTALATVAYMQDWDWELADREFRMAIDASPGGNYPLVDYCLYLLYCKRFEQSFAFAQRNIDLDPLNKYNHLVLGFLLLNAGERDRAETHFKSMMERWPDYDWPVRELAWTYAPTGRAAEAVPLYEKCGDSLNMNPSILGPWVAAGRSDEVRDLLDEQKIIYQEDRMPQMALGIAWGHQILGDRDSVVIWLDRIEAVSKDVTDGNLAYHTAIVYGLMGDPDSGMRWLTRACDLRAPNMTGLLIDWRLDTFRSHPEFVAIVKRVGFPGY